MQKNKIINIRHLYEAGLSVNFIANSLKIDEDYVGKVVSGEITEDSI